MIAGTAIAIASGVLGYFLVTRAQLFTADALGHVAFTGALIALCFGVDARVGLFAGTVAVALLLGALERRGRADDVVIGSTFAWVLGIGVLALSIFTRGGTGDSGSGVRILFGSIGALDHAATVTAVAVAAGVVVVALAIARPLLFATVDDDVAAARGVPVRLLGLAFLALVGVEAAEATQAVGALLVLGLLAAPAGAAVRLTTRPYRAMVLAAAIAVGSVWAGLAWSDAVAGVPPSFAIVAIATAAYACSFAAGRGTARVRRSVQEA